MIGRLTPGTHFNWTDFPLVTQFISEGAVFCVLPIDLNARRGLEDRLCPPARLPPHAAAPQGPNRTKHPEVTASEAQQQALISTHLPEWEEVLSSRKV